MTNNIVANVDQHVLISLSLSDLPSVNCNESNPSFSSESSSSSKRRGTFKKWLTNPVRKLSQGRSDKPSSESPKPSGGKKSLSSPNWKVN